MSVNSRLRVQATSSDLTCRTVHTKSDPTDYRWVVMANLSTAAGETQLSLREQQKLFTRQRLIQAALEVIADRGYAAATIDDIVAAAGASRATFYLHFKNKLELVRGLLDVLSADGLEKWKRLAEIGDPTWDELHEWVEKDAIPYYERNRSVIAAVEQAIASEPELASTEVSARLQRMIDALGGFLKNWRRSDAEHAHLRCVMLMLELDRFCILWIVHGAEYPKDLAVDALTDSWWAALNPPPRGRSPRRPARSTKR